MRCVGSGVEWPVESSAAESRVDRRKYSGGELSIRAGASGAFEVWNYYQTKTPCWRNILRNRRELNRRHHESNCQINKELHMGSHILWKPWKEGENNWLRTDTIFCPLPCDGTPQESSPTVTSLLQPHATVIDNDSLLSLWQSSREFLTCRPWWFWAFQWAQCYSVNLWIIDPPLGSAPWSRVRGEGKPFVLRAYWTHCVLCVSSCSFQHHIFDYHYDFYSYTNELVLFIVLTAVDFYIVSVSVGAYAIAASLATAFLAEKRHFNVKCNGKLAECIPNWNHYPDTQRVGRNWSTALQISMFSVSIHTFAELKISGMQASTRHHLWDG